MTPTKQQLGAFHSYIRRLALNINAMGLTKPLTIDVGCTEASLRHDFETITLGGLSIKDVSRAELAQAMEVFETAMNQNGFETYIGINNL